MTGMRSMREQIHLEKLFLDRTKLRIPETRYIQDSIRSATDPLGDVAALIRNVTCHVCQTGLNLGGGAWIASDLLHAGQFVSQVDLRLTKVCISRSRLRGKRCLGASAGGIVWVSSFLGNARRNYLAIICCKFTCRGNRCVLCAGQDRLSHQWFNNQRTTQCLDSCSKRFSPLSNLR